MGGQACIAYGAAEFSRDVDVAVAAEAKSLSRLRAALRELDAEAVYVPPLGVAALKRGHACHFRCRAAGLEGFRIDVMSRMRGVDAFPALWRRRTEIPDPEGGTIALLSLADLVRAKKTQRDKDWPMIRRLVDVSIETAAARPGLSLVEMWFAECRSPELLRQLVHRFPRAARSAASKRPAVRHALNGDEAGVETALRAEEDNERRLDREYWEPLKRELEKMRLGRRK